MMRDKKNFADLLMKFVKRDGRRVRQIARASGIDGHYPVSHVTINRWLQGYVKKPRAWQELVKLAIALHLSKSEADELLTSAHNRPITELQEIANSDSDRTLLSHWDETPPPESPFQAPPNWPNFTGRQAKLQELKEAVLQNVGILCLQGMAGAGKTMLAIHAAYQLREYFPDGVLWAQLERSDTISVLHSFASAYGYNVNQYTDLGSRSSKVRELLANKRTLIVLDNAKNDEDIRPLLPPTGSCTVIITTRRHDLSVADGGQRFNISPFNKKETLALFAQILGERRAQRHSTTLNEIADLLGHLPLALAIVANRMKHEFGCSIANFSQRIRQEQRRLKELVRGDQGVRLSFDLSYNELPPELQHFFAALGTFEGEDFSVAAAAYLTALPVLEAQDYLQQLYRLSLVQPARAERYKLHPLLRDYSRQKNASQSPHSERMVTFFIDYIVVHKSNYTTLDWEIDHLFAALEMAFELDMKTSLVRGATAFYSFLRARGQYQQAKHHLLRAEQAAREIGDLGGVTTVLRHLAQIANKEGHYNEAKEMYKKALILAQQTGNVPQTSALLTSLGALAHRRGKSSQAKQHYEEAMSLARQVGDESRIAALLTNLGLMASERGDNEQAELSYLQALDLLQKGNQKRLLCTLRQNLGQLMYDRGDYAQAKVHFQEGFTVACQIGDPELKSRMLGNLGLVAIAFTNYAEAAAHIRSGLSFAKRGGVNLQITRQLANLGLVATVRRIYDQANLHYEEALALARKNDFPFDICVILNRWGECHLAQQKLYEAASAFDEALQTAQKAQNFQQEVATSLYGLARIAAKRGNVSKARQLGSQSQLIFTTIGNAKSDELKWWLTELPGEVLLGNSTLEVSRQQS